MMAMKLTDTICRPRELPTRRHGLTNRSMLYCGDNHISMKWRRVSLPLSISRSVLPTVGQTEPLPPCMS
jgi:hypothetical protein